MYPRWTRVTQIAFDPGRFAWITVGRSPFSLTADPFSLSSSAERPGSIRFTIKAAGDFAARGAFEHDGGASNHGGVHPGTTLPRR